MSSSKAPIELFIDVFTLKAQRALVLPTLTPIDLVGAVLQEFRELEYLSMNRDMYRLVKTDGSELTPERPLSKQVNSQDKLAMIEVSPKKPAHAQEFTKRVYLREHPIGNVYKLHWAPAIIGRPDPDIKDDHLAVNLSTNPNGLRVSRRHARITEDRGNLYVESMSPNPTTVTDTQRNITTTLLQGQKVLIQQDDLILLDRSSITLRVIVADS